VFVTQDDDCVTDLRPVIEAYDPAFIVNAMTAPQLLRYPNRQTLIGFGSIFHRSMLDCFTKWPWERDALFYRESDRIFATVNPHKSVTPEIRLLDHHDAPNRYCMQPDHNPARFAMERRILEVTGIAA
jgi:hypothetical protein